ncbi:hypothetical protein [Acidithiobacillus sp.]|uniref:hypothetical protein n=1 Tax=Acidithiobacillus sp. TaxID=1872118 RepID=UPI0026084ECA|nr:hypothetical protein [Acidithiobacillus sp.]MDD5280287.1 hypothetical protein [Acidithiobacillus sp.]
MGKISSTRELMPHESYRRVYEIYTATVWVLSLVHTAGQWLPVKQKYEVRMLYFRMRLLRSG